MGRTGVPDQDCQLLDQLTDCFRLGPAPTSDPSNAEKLHCHRGSRSTAQPPNEAYYKLSVDRYFTRIASTTCSGDWVYCCF